MRTVVNCFNSTYIFVKVVSKWVLPGNQQQMAWNGNILTKTMRLCVYLRERAKTIANFQYANCTPEKQQHSIAYSAYSISDGCKWAWPQAHFHALSASHTKLELNSTQLKKGTFEFPKSWSAVGKIHIVLSYASCVQCTYLIARRNDFYVEIRLLLVSFMDWRFRNSAEAT